MKEHCYMKDYQHQPWARRVGLILLNTFALIPVIAAAATVDAVWNSATDVTVTANGYSASGNTINLSLNFTPAVGTELKVVNNTGPSFIVGTFDNLAQGQVVPLSHAGVTYQFAANYYGGSGNDLVLFWAGRRAFAWGWDQYGQLGDNRSGTNRLQPVPVTATGVLAGKTVVALAAGYYHSLALCSDGTLAAWGRNDSGQLGDNTTTERHVPVPVNLNAGSALYGKRVVAIAAGLYHSLALCSDGSVAAWGRNSDGQLGDNTAMGRLLPVAVNTGSGVSAIYGKAVAAIAAGSSHSVALCSDGTVAAWGRNNYGQLGNRSTTGSYVPVAVNSSSEVSALYGKMVTSIAAGGVHSVALCWDGMVAAWGRNNYGQLGDNTGRDTNAPVAVNTGLGISALHSRTVVSIAAGMEHTLALCSDGTVAAWGRNFEGQLGDDMASGAASLKPVVVNTNEGVSALYSTIVTAIAAGYNHSLAVCLDGTAAAWGSRAYGQLGNNSTTISDVPVPVDTTALATGRRFASSASGCCANHTLAVVAAPAASETVLTDPRELSDGTFQVTFTNTPGAFLSLVTATNPGLPLDNWSALGDPAELSPGHFQFTDSQATSEPHRYYRVCSP
jgi:alpha-tubulin suppressor-like RCC1 family protein